MKLFCGTPAEMKTHFREAKLHQTPKSFIPPNNNAYLTIFKNLIIITSGQHTTIAVALPKQVLFIFQQQ